MNECYNAEGFFSDEDLDDMFIEDYESDYPNENDEWFNEMLYKD